MRRGQVEAMGLVIIVILIVMIGLFFLIFSINGGEESHEDLFLSMKANNLVNSLKSMDMGDSNFGSKIIDCCAGNLMAQEEVMGAVMVARGMIDEKIAFEVECAYGDCPGFSECSGGITSERIVLSSGDRFFATICRK